MKQATFKKLPPFIARQGDVLIRQLAELPADVTPKSKGSRVVLAHGEATGHHHSIPRFTAEDFITGNGGTVVNVTKDTTLDHQEHTAIPLSPGVYAVERQREYSPAAIRNVAD